MVDITKGIQQMPLILNVDEEGANYVLTLRVFSYREAQSVLISKLTLATKEDVTAEINKINRFYKVKFKTF